MRNNRKCPQHTANGGGASVKERNAIALDAKTWGVLENRRAQALGGSSPSPSAGRAGSREREAGSGKRGAGSREPEAGSRLPWPLNPDMTGRLSRRTDLRVTDQT